MEIDKILESASKMTGEECQRLLEKLQEITGSKINLNHEFTPWFIVLQTSADFVDYNKVAALMQFLGNSDGALKNMVHIVRDIEPAK